MAADVLIVTALNVEWEAADRALTLEQARERAASSRDALLEALRGVPDDRIDERVLDLALDDPVDHFETHFRWMVQGVMRDEERWWNAIEAALDAHPGGRFHLEGDPWDARDVWAHLARWLNRAVDVCEADQVCNGTSSFCPPAPRFRAPGTECRAAVGLCDAADTCTGNSVACPADARKGPASQCRHPVKRIRHPRPG